MVLVAPAFGQSPVNLSWKFKENVPFYQEMKTTTDQTMKVMGSDIKQRQEQTFFFSWTPVKREGDNWQIKQKIEGVRVKIEIGGQPVEYDSTREGASATALGDFFKALVGSEFTLTLNKDLKVTEVKGRDAFLSKLTTANPQMDTLLKQILSEDALKEMADPSFASIPSSPKKPGESWERPSKLEMGPIGRYDNTYKYTYEGKDKTNAKLDRIKIDTTLKYQPPVDSAAASGLPFKIKSAQLASKNSGGAVLFDNEKGRVDSSDLTIDLTGTLAIEIAGTTTQVQLDQKQTTSVKTTDTNPIAKK